MFVRLAPNIVLQNDEDFEDVIRLDSYHIIP
jgi:hypothetical protein